MARALLIIAVMIFAGRTYAQQATPPSRVFSEVGIDQKLDEQIPLDLTFRDENGNTVALGKYFHERPVVLALVYYECPMLCTQVLSGMVETFRTITLTPGKEFDVIAVSIDPTEGPELAAEKKKRYVKAYGRPETAEGWHFLTGDETSIKTLADVVGFRYVYDEKSGQYAHAAGIMIITPEGKIARYLYGIEYAALDLRFSLMEATQERIGSATDQLLLLCYHYDPTTGKYSMVVTNLLRAGGAVTLLVLGGFMLVMFRRDRKRKVQTPPELGRAPISRT